MTDDMNNAALRVGPDGDPDRYCLGSLAGAGAEGLLYRGTLTTESGVVLEVAIKMLHPRLVHRIETFGRRWAEQIELFRSLQAPGMVAVRDGFTGPLPHPAGQIGAVGQRGLYLVMNWVDGEPLETWAAHHRDASPAERLKLLLPIAAALDLAHSGIATGGVPVVHCDIKPANILVTSDTDAVLVDIGLTRVLPRGTRSTAITGTPGYLAPEVLSDGEYSPASDRYALGVVAWSLLTGIEPPAPYDPDALRRELEIAYPDQPELVAHVLAMLALRPEQRPVLLANWCAQLRNSSLAAGDDIRALAPIAPAQAGASIGRSQSRSARLNRQSAGLNRRSAWLNRSSAGLNRRSAGLNRRSAGLHRPSRRTKVAAVVVAAALLVVAVVVATARRGTDDHTQRIASRSSTSPVLRSATGLGSGTTVTTPQHTTTVPPARLPTPVPTTQPGGRPVILPSLSPPSTSPPPTITTVPMPRFTPVITAQNESYGVRVYGVYDPAGTLFATIRRSDESNSDVQYATSYSAFNNSWVVGANSRRCLTSTGGDVTAFGETTAHGYLYGVVGLDAVKVEAVWTDGSQIAATLGNQTLSIPVRWWILPFGPAGGQLHQLIATASSGATWAITAPAFVGNYGETGC